MEIQKARPLSAEEIRRKATLEKILLESARSEALYKRRREESEKQCAEILYRAKNKMWPYGTNAAP